LLQTNLDNNDDADVFINQSQQVGLSTNWTYGGRIVPGLWHRIVLTVKDNVPNAYIDGVLVSPGSVPDARWSLANNAFYLFADDNGECKDIDVAEIRYWKEVLTMKQIAKLKGVDYPYIYVDESNVSLKDNDNQFSLHVKSSIVPKVEMPDWIKSVTVTPSTGEQTYTFKADDMTDAGSRQGTITISPADGSEVTPCVITVDQSYDGGRTPICTGKWTFDDAANIFTSTEGNATLTPYLVADDGTLTLVDDPKNANVLSIAGPTDANKAITLERGTCFKLGVDEASQLSNYTIQYDVRMSSFSKYHGLLQTTLANNDDADIFINRNAQVGLGVAGFGYSGQLNTDTWYRITLVVTNGYVSIYLDGDLLKTATDLADNRWVMDKTGAMLFCDNDGEIDTIDIAELDFWNSALTSKEIEKIGKIALK
jgi:hypothetical protein